MAEVPPSSGAKQRRVASQLPPVLFSVTGFNTFGEKLTVYFDETGLGFLLHSNCGEEPLPCGPGRGPFMALTAPMDEATGVLVTPARHQETFREALRKQGSIDETLWVEFAWCFGQAALQRRANSPGRRAALVSPPSPESHDVEAISTPSHVRSVEARESPPKEAQPGQCERQLERLPESPLGQEHQKLHGHLPRPQQSEGQELSLTPAPRQEEQLKTEEHLRRGQQTKPEQQRETGPAEQRLAEQQPGEQQRRLAKQDPDGQQVGKRRRLRRALDLQPEQQLPQAEQQAEQQPEQQQEQQQEQLPEFQPEQQPEKQLEQQVVVFTAASSAAAHELTGVLTLEPTPAGARRNPRRRVQESLRGLECVELPLEAVAVTGGGGSNKASGTGRPKRHRMPPLQAWRNERIEYERLPGSATPSIKWIVQNKAGRLGQEHTSGVAGVHRGRNA